MANVRATITVDVNSSAANAGLASLQSRLAALNKQMVAGAGAASAANARLLSDMGSYLNRSGQWTAATGNMMTATGRLAQQLDKGTMTMQQWRETSRRATKQMGDNATMNQLAAQRVRALQSQYVALGREVDGTQKVMKMQPTGMLKDWGAEAMFAQQQAVLFRRRLEAGANSMINWGKNTQWAGRQMMVGMGIPLGIAAVGAVRSFKDIEQASISFKRVYGDATTSVAEKSSMLKTITSEVANEMTKYGIAYSDTIDVAAKAAATGAKGNDLMAATRETMRLATLGNMDYMTALESTIATQTAFGVSANKMTRVTDFLNAAENQTILSMEDMAKAVPRVAPVIKGLGGNIEDLGVLMTALRAGGVTAEQGANALKSGLASLINPTDAAVEKLDSLGIPLNKIVQANKGDLIGTVKAFGKALGGLPKFEQQQALESLFGKYQFARMGALFKNINRKQAQETERLSRESSANLAKMSENELSQISDSALYKFQGAVERLKAAAAPLGEQILSTLAPMVDVIAKVVGFFADNAAARNIALFGAAFAGLAGVGVMLTGVFANFFGTMAKGFLFARRGMDRMMGRKLPSYQSLADLEAAAAQKQLGAAAAGAVGGLYAEAQAAQVLSTALDMLTMDAREAAAAVASIGGIGPGGYGGVGGYGPGTPGGGPGGTGGTPTKPLPGTPPIMPFGKQHYVGELQRAHISAGQIIDDRQMLQTIIDTSKNKTLVDRAQRAMDDLDAGRQSTLKGYSNMVLLMSKDLNQAMNSGKVAGSRIAEDLRMLGPDAMASLSRSLAQGAGVPYEDFMKMPGVQAWATHSVDALARNFENQLEVGDEELQKQAPKIVQDTAAKFMPQYAGLLDQMMLPIYGFSDAAAGYANRGVASQEVIAALGGPAGVQGWSAETIAKLRSFDITDQDLLDVITGGRGGAQLPDIEDIQQQEKSATRRKADLLKEKDAIEKQQKDLEKRRAALGAEPDDQASAEDRANYLAEKAALDQEEEELNQRSLENREQRDKELTNLTKQEEHAIKAQRQADHDAQKAQELAEKHSQQRSDFEQERIDKQKEIADLDQEMAKLDNSVAKEREASAQKVLETSKKSGTALNLSAGQLKDWFKIMDEQATAGSQKIKNAAAGLQAGGFNIDPLTATQDDVMNALAGLREQAQEDLYTEYASKRQQLEDEIESSRKNSEILDDLISESEDEARKSQDYADRQSELADQSRENQQRIDREREMALGWASQEEERQRAAAEREAEKRRRASFRGRLGAGFERTRGAVASKFAALREGGAFTRGASTMANATAGLSMLGEVGLFTARSMGMEFSPLIDAAVMGTGALAMIPGVINPYTAAIAAATVAVGGTVLAYNYVEEQARQSGIAMGEFATLSNKNLVAMEEAYGKQSLYTKVMNRQAAEQADVSTKAYEQAQQIAQTEFGQQFSQSFADALVKGGEDFATSSAASNLASAVLQKIVTPGQAKALTASIIGGTSGEAVKAEFQSIVGRGGTLVKQDPVAFALKDLKRSQQLATAATNNAIEKTREGVDYGKAFAESDKFIDGLEGPAKTIIDFITGGAIKAAGIEIPGIDLLRNQLIDTVIEKGFGTVGNIATDNAEIAKAEGYAATIWSNSVATGYQNRIAAEERLRLAQLARKEASKTMRDLEDQGLKGSKEYKQAAQNYKTAETIISSGRKTMPKYDTQMALGVREGLKQFSDLGKVADGGAEAQQQYLDTQFEALKARYAGDAARTELLMRDKSELDAGVVANVPKEQRNNVLAAANMAMSSGMLPGDFQKYAALGGQKAFTQLPDILKQAGSGGAIMESYRSVAGLSVGAGKQRGIFEGLLGVKSPQEFDQYNNKLAEFDTLGKQAQKSLANFVPDASVKQVKSWGNALQNNNKSIKDVVTMAENQAFKKSSPSMAPWADPGSRFGLFAPGKKTKASPLPYGPPIPGVSPFGPQPLPQPGAPGVGLTGPRMIAPGFLPGILGGALQTFGGFAQSAWNTATGFFGGLTGGFPGMPGAMPGAMPGMRPGMMAGGLFGMGPGAMFGMGMRPGMAARQQSMFGQQPMPAVPKKTQGQMIKPDKASAALAGKAEGVARATAMNSALTQRNRQVAPQQITQAKNVGTQQGKVQGQAIGAGIGASVGRTKSGAAKLLGDLGKGSKAGQIQLKVNDAGATGKINKVKGAMNKLKSAKTDIKIKGTDQLSPKAKKAHAAVKKVKDAKVNVKMKGTENISPKANKAKAALAKVKAIGNINKKIDATDNASPQAEKAAAALRKIEGINPKSTITVNDNGTPIITTVQTGLNNIAATNPSPSISANDNASGTISSVAANLAALDGSSATVTINVKKGGSVAGGGYIDSMYFANGGGFESMTRGTFTGRKVVGPGGPEADKVPAWLSPGEFVMRQKAVKKYGVGLMYAMNALKLRNGGRVPGNQTNNPNEEPDNSDKPKDKPSDGDGKWKWSDVKKELDKSFNAVTRGLKVLPKQISVTGKGFKSGMQRAAVQAALGDDPKALDKYLKMTSKERKDLAKKIYQTKIREERIARKQELLQAESDARFATRLNEKRLKLSGGVINKKGKTVGAVAKKIGGKKVADIDQLRQTAIGMTDEEVQSYFNIQRKNAKKTKQARNNYLRKVQKRRDKEEKVAMRSDFFAEMDSLGQEQRFQTAVSKAYSGEGSLAKFGFNPEQLANLTSEQFNQLMTLPANEANRFAEALKDASDATVAAQNAAAKKDLKKQISFAGRFQNPKLAGLSDAALANLTQEDFERLNKMAGPELQNWIDTLNLAASANQEAEKAAARLAQKLEYVSMTEGQRYQEVSNQMNTLLETFRGQGEAMAQALVVQSTGQTSTQLEAESAMLQVLSDQINFENEKRQRIIERINKNYEKQQKILDKVERTQQSIANIERGRLSVSSALSSGDISAAAMAAQEAKANEAQTNRDIMRQQMQESFDALVEFQQEAIDLNQDRLNEFSDAMARNSMAIAQAQAIAGLEMANQSAQLEKQKIALENSASYWTAIRNDIVGSNGSLTILLEAFASVNEKLGTIDPLYNSIANFASTAQSKTAEMNANYDAIYLKLGQINTTLTNTFLELDKIDDPATTFEGIVSVTEAHWKNIVDYIRSIPDLVNKIDFSNLNPPPVPPPATPPVTPPVTPPPVTPPPTAPSQSASSPDKPPAPARGTYTSPGTQVITEEEEGKKRWQRFVDRFEKLNAVDKTAVIKAAFKNQTDTKKNRERYLSWTKAKQERMNAIVDKGKVTKAEEEELKRFALGGWVGGTGNKDSIAALLTPGEFVVNKKAAALFGPALERINSPSYNFANPAGMPSATSMNAGNVYNLTVNAGSNASADDIATITIQRIKQMEQRSIRERMI